MIASSEWLRLLIIAAALFTSLMAGGKLIETNEILGWASLSATSILSLYTLCGRW